MWVEYHLFAGVDHIYLFDHNSTRSMHDEVWDYVQDGRVQYTSFRSMPLRAPQIRYFAEGLQGRIYQTCFDWARDYFTWIAFIDLDEFLVVTDPKPITHPLVVYHYNGAVNEWRERVAHLGGGVSGFTRKNSQIYEQADAQSTLDCKRGAEAAKVMPRRPLPRPEACGAK
ncbi:hypothetical protein GPECTOR_27g700 [Gonium pectorale]|uniref:Glycosyltransferase family 92 protein n=1 Tax=Gonium pectorale TaxID=33097 RepID=A0A150GF94_GONPE|nr:hypothetical protein GPECTOR_27g700 [Gonium pectorale]|eukprot:KXZ48529.1 hypothetical protein GPECTOR_27g700 [Gonium pectorale]